MIFYEISRESFIYKKRKRTDTYSSIQKKMQLHILLSNKYNKYIFVYLIIIIINNLCNKLLWRIEVYDLTQLLELLYTYIYLLIFE